MYSYSFNQAIKKILANEGGYVNNPNDSGGETNFGISKRSYPNVDIKSLTQDEAIEIYHKDYWLKYNLHKFESCRLQYKLFDLTINAGNKAAIRCLQNALRCISNNEDKLLVDGILGKNTFESYYRYSKNEGLYFSFKSEMASFYRSLNQKIFEKGWLNRAYQE